MWVSEDEMRMWHFERASERWMIEDAIEMGYVGSTMYKA